MDPNLPPKTVVGARSLPAPGAGSMISVDALAAARAVSLHYLDRQQSMSKAPGLEGEPQATEDGY